MSKTSKEDKYLLDADVKEDVCWKILYYEKKDEHIVGVCTTYGGWDFGRPFSIRMNMSLTGMDKESVVRALPDQWDGSKSKEELANDIERIRQGNDSDYYHFNFFFHDFGGIELLNIPEEMKAELRKFEKEPSRMKM